MVYDIIYTDENGKDYCLFDIDIYLEEKSRLGGDILYWTEVNKICMPAGVAKFVFDKIHTEEELLEFQDYCGPLHNIRGILHEEMYDGYLEFDEAKRRQDEEHLPVLVGIIRNFADKYNLKIK